MKTMSLTLLAAAAIGAITLGSATAMPFSTNSGAAQLADGLVQDVRVVCDRRGRCWNTGYRQSRRYYQPGYSSGYYGRGYAEPGYGYGYRRGPRVGIGVGPIGFGIY